jgi:hypothetical protein
MSTETMMWSFAIMFMIHEFEEIIMLKPWLSKNKMRLSEFFPRLAANIIQKYDRLSTSSIAFAVLEQFMILTGVIFICVIFKLYSIWAGVVTGYLIHILGHLAQFLVYRRYCPFLLTSIVSVPYCMYCLYLLFDWKLISLGSYAMWTFVAFILIVINLLFVHKLAVMFDTWLKSAFGSANLD